MNTEISAESVRAKEAEALLNIKISAESVRAKEAEALFEYRDFCRIGKSKRS